MCTGAKKRQRGKPRNRLNCREQTDVYQKGDEWGGGLNKRREFKECTCCDEHWVLCGSIESLYCTPETNMLTTWDLNKNLKNK